MADDDAAHDLMKAAYYERYGPPEVVEIREVERPTPSEGQVLVRVRAASVNRADLDGLKPKPGFVRLFMGLRAPRNHEVGIDAAGVVEAVGPGVTRFKPGDEVMTDLFAAGRFGSFAEYVCAREKAFEPIPAGMSFEEAATLPHSAVLALQGMRMRDGRTFKPGDKVLIDGASGNVGPFAVQIAKAMGAEVTGVASGDKLDFVRSLGADHAIDYEKVDYTKAGERYDWIVSVDAHYPIRAARRALKPNGVYLTMGGDDRHYLRGDGRQPEVAVRRQVVRAPDLVEADAPAGRRHPEGADRRREAQAGDRSALPARPGRRGAPLGRGWPRPGQGGHHRDSMSRRGR